MSYQFRTECGEVVEVDFETAMNQDVAGYITLADGREARRVNRPSSRRVAISHDPSGKPIVSDTLGFGEHQLGEMEAHRDAGGHDVQFIRDPQCPWFYQAKFDSRASWKKYMKSRGFYEDNGGNGGGNPISGELLERGKRAALRNL